jgi:hypothetical protein
MLKGSLAIVVLLAALAAGRAWAVPIVLDASDSGSYRANGLHNPNIENHITGQFNGVENRSFFVFDVSGVSGTIQAATLRLFNPEVSAFLHGYVSPDPTETLNIYDVSTPAADVVGNTAGVAGFADLGSGALYGSRVVSASDNGTVVEIALGPAALADLNNASGPFVLGGALGTISGSADQYVFGFSVADFVEDHTRQLVLQVRAVPEPPVALLLVGLTLGLMACAQRGRIGRRLPQPP